jgi:hypothetical protein
MQLEAASGKGNPWMVCGTLAGRSNHLQFLLSCRVIIDVDPRRSLICRAYFPQRTPYAFRFWKRPQLPLRHAGMLSPELDMKQDECFLFDCRTWRAAMQRRLTIYRREKDASITRELQFCNPMRVLACALSKAFFLILWSGEVGYVRPFFEGMAASRAVIRSTPLGKML